MKKIHAILVIVPLFLVSCNLPFQVTSTPTVDVIATQVVQRLTNVPTATLANLPKPTNTLLVPASTITPTQQAAQPTQTAAQTKTETVSAKTPTSSPTVTSLPGDPRSSLGPPTWKDNFQKASSWGLETPYDDGHTRVAISPGKLILKSYDANGWHGWRFTYIKIQDFYLEVTIQTGTCTAGDLYGLIFRSPDSFKGYWFNVTCDGRYGLDAGDINNSDVLIKLKTNPALKSGSNQVNRLGVMAKGNKLSLYANGKLLEEINDGTYTGQGVFGYFIASNKTAGFTYESTEIAYWNIP